MASDAPPIWVVKASPSRASASRSSSASAPHAAGHLVDLAAELFGLGCEALLRLLADLADRFRRQGDALGDLRALAGQLFAGDLVVSCTDWMTARMRSSKRPASATNSA